MLQRTKLIQIFAINTKTTTDSNGNSTSVDSIDANPIKLLAHSIKYGVTLGTEKVMGLNDADLVNWYVEPITISIQGVSIVTPNPMINSDNIIPAMIAKFNQYLSESTFNYYNRPRFRLLISNGIQSFDQFEGVIKSFPFSESADYVDKYDYSLEFEGKYFNAAQNGAKKQASDVSVTSQTSNQTNNIDRVISQVPGGSSVLYVSSMVNRSIKTITQ